MKKSPKPPEDQLNPFEKAVMLAGDRAMKRLMEEVRQQKETAEKGVGTSVAAESARKAQTSRRIKGRRQTEEKDSAQK